MVMVNLNNGRVLAWQIKEATSFVPRLVVQMRTRTLPLGNALHIRPCRTANTFFLQSAIDVVHLDGGLQIVGIERDLAPGRVGAMFERSVSVVELPAGTVAGTGTEVGHAVLFKS